MERADLLAPMHRTSTVGGDVAPRVWLTVDETVAYLALPSRMALYQAVRRGQVPAHRFGRRLRFRRSELDAALAPR